MQWNGGDGRGWSGKEEGDIEENADAGVGV